MEHSVFIWVSSVSKGEKKSKVQIDPEKLGAVKSESRTWSLPLWCCFEPSRDYRS